MADKILTAVSNGGLKLTETTSEYQGELDPANIAAVTELDGDDYLVVSVGGVLKKLQLKRIIKEDEPIYAGDPANLNYIQFNAGDGQWEFYVAGVLQGAI